MEHPQHYSVDLDHRMDLVLLHQLKSNHYQMNTRDSMTASSRKENVDIFSIFLKICGKSVILSFYLHYQSIIEYWKYA